MIMRNRLSRESSFTPNMGFRPKCKIQKANESFVTAEGFAQTFL